MEYGNDALASDLFSQWLESGGVAPQHDPCIGYKVPLFLHGSDTVDNLEVTDMDVYWSICGQALHANRAANRVAGRVSPPSPHTT